MNRFHQIGLFTTKTRIRPTIELRILKRWSGGNTPRFTTPRADQWGLLYAKGAERVSRD